MLSVFLLAVVGADSHSIQRPGTRNDFTAVTCVRQAAMVVTPQSGCVLLTAAVAEPTSTSACLHLWEIASQQVPERLRSQRDDFRRRVHDQFNEHTAAAVEELLGRVTERGLTDSFVWRIVEHDADQVRLEAISRDATERLFYSSLKVSLSADRGGLEQISVVSRDQTQRVVWQVEAGQSDDRVLLVGFEDAVPPAPSQTIRTSDLRLGEQTIGHPRLKR